MRIYVDFDDVLCETARELSRLVLELYGCRVPYEAIHAFNLREAFGLDEARYLHLMHIAHGAEQLLALEPTPGAVAAVAGWMGEGYTVEIVTGRPYATHEASALWLRRHGLEGVPLVHVDKYNREPPAAEGQARALTRGEFAERRYDLAVEDAPMALEQLAAMPPCRVVIFDRPWNRGVPLLTEHFTRCRDWPAVEEVAADCRRLAAGSSSRQWQ